MSAEESNLSDNKEKAELEIKTNLEDVKHVRLNIAITGECGSGKSTFVNAFRGMKNSDDGAAPTGVVETTMELDEYQHPRYKNVILWDLPGVGTTKLTADRYLEHVKFKTYDFFIIVADDRFRENDAKLSKKIKKMGKKFYFVRSKIDQDLRNEQRSQKEYSEEKTLVEIKENCIKGLEEQGVALPQVFLVSSFDLYLYDFPALHETIRTELPSHKRDVLMLALPNVSSSIITKKKEVFSSQIKYYALLSAGVAAVPIPGLSFAADLGILAHVLNSYLVGFGLDVKSLEKVSRATNKSLDDLRVGLKCLCSGKEVTKQLVLQILKSLSFLLISETAEESTRWIPVFGFIIAAAFSFKNTSWFLHHMLDSLSNDAETVMQNASNSH